MNLPNKKVIILLSVLFIVIVVIVFFYISIVSSKTISARLLVEKDKVFVNDKEIFEEYILNEKDKITISETGGATIILYESIIVILEPGTTITVVELSQRNPELFQENGGTWNKVTNLFGIDKYTIRTSTSVASVRGTEFYLTNSSIFVSEGEVDYEIDGNSYVVQEGQAVERFGELIKERSMTSIEKIKAGLRRLDSVSALKKLRMLELEKHRKTLDFFEKKYSFTDKDVFNYFERADRGEVNIEELREKVPVGIDSVEKIIALTNKIEELNSQSSR